MSPDFGFSLGFPEPCGDGAEEVAIRSGCEGFVDTYQKDDFGRRSLGQG